MSVYRLIIVILLTTISAGCSGIDYHDHPLLNPDLDQPLREVEPFKPDESGKKIGPPPETDEKAQLEDVMSDPPVEKTFRFSIAEVRQSTLQNNTDLTAAFFDPSIAATKVDVERAKFESTFNLKASRSRTVGPEYTAAAAQLDDTIMDQALIDPTLNVPLVTGGTITLEPLMGSNDYKAPRGESKYWHASAQLGLNQPLLRNAGVAYNKGSILLAMYQERIDAAKTKLIVINTLLNAEVAYWRVYLSRQVLKIQREQYELYRKELSDAKKLEKGGVRTMADVYGFETGLARQVGSVVQADNDLRQAVRELKVLMHKPSLSLDSMAGVEPTTKPSLVHYQFDSKAMVHAALKNRMELLEIELQLASDNLGILLAKNQSLPQLDLNLSGTWNGFSARDLSNAWSRLFSSSDDTGWNVGLTASIPLGNKAAKAQLRQAMLTRLQDIATRSQRKITIAKDVYSAIDTLNTTWFELLAARYRLKAAQNNFIAEKKLFTLGNRTSTDVSTALLSLGTARVAEAQAAVTYQISMAQLAAATGTLLGYSSVEWADGDEGTVIPPAYIVK